MKQFNKAGLVALGALCGLMLGLSQAEAGGPLPVNLPGVPEMPYYGGPGPGPFMRPPPPPPPYVVPFLPPRKCPPPPVGANVDADGCWVMQGLAFEFDKAVIRPETTASLDNAIQVLKLNGAIGVLIQGHTDSIGTMRYNQHLSEARAESVKAYMVQHGIDASRLATIGYGKTRPITANDTPEARALNRRVELAPAL